jgi:hypothetical protein
MNDIQCLNHTKCKGQGDVGAKTTYLRAAKRIKVNWGPR